MWWFGVDGCFAGAELEVCFAHLVESESVVKWGDGDVTAVEHLEWGCVGIQRGAVVEASEGSLARRSGANGTGTETCS